MIDAHELEPVELNAAELIECLRALTDPAHRAATHLVPTRAPSELPVED
jgi:hypothetical protein